MITATCSCQVVEHPAGSAWVAMTEDRTCGQGHKHGQRWAGEGRLEETR